MTYLTRYVPAITFAAMVAVMAGCQGSDANDSDSILDRNLELASARQDSARLNDVPVTSAPPVVQSPPVVQTPVRTPPRQVPPRTVATPPVRTVEPPVVPLPAPTTGTIAAGTRVQATLASRVCTSAKSGDRIVAQTLDGLYGSNGVSIPSGATVVLEVASSTPMTDSTPGRINFRIRSLESAGRTYAVVATAVPAAELVRTRTTETKDDVKKVAGGAVAGAIIGQILGKDTKGTVIGAAAGAAAGTAVAMATARNEGCAADRSAVMVTLVEPLILPIAG